MDVNVLPSINNGSLLYFINVGISVGIWKNTNLNDTDTVP